MNKLSLIAVLFLLANVSRSADLAVFGLEFGKPVQLPECESTSPFVQKTCVTKEGKFPGDTHHYVYFSSADTPSIVDQFSTSDNATASFGLDLMLDQNGALIGLSFLTPGISYQTRILDQLTAKYGKPTRRKTVQVQNGFGARFDVIHALWNLPNLTVLFDGALAQLNQGSVTIDSPEAAKMRDAEAKPQQGKSL
jgi:hypothetical protein